MRNMTERAVIPIQQHASTKAWPTLAQPALPPGTDWLDRHQRPLRDLRISVTDRCNFRCTYCMPKAVYDQDHVYLPHKDLLSFEEITRVAKLFVAQEVTKLRLTGGEPLLRKNLELLIEQLSALQTPQGQALDITLTTNGSLLGRKAKGLKAAGLKRVTVSLDALSDPVFKAMNDVDFPVADVLHGIDAAQDAGLGPIKVNMVVKKGVNDAEIVPMARYFRDKGVALRFIEFMDVGSTNQWRRDDVLPNSEVLQRLQTLGPLVALQAQTAGETAERWAWADAQGKPLRAQGEIGLISSVSKPFCGDCNRIRLSTEGKLYTCLFAAQGHDLRALLRSGMGDQEITAHLAAMWQARQDRYSELRAQAAPTRPKIEMSYIGG
jgi:GTP 3',8-cyclase